MIQYGHPTINWHTVFIYFRNVKTLNALLSAELNTHYNNKKKSSMMETVPKKIISIFGELWDTAFI